MKNIVKTIKDNCYKETEGIGIEEELRYFMTEKDVIELAETIITNHSYLSNISDTIKLGKIDDVLENTPEIDLEEYDHDDVKIMNDTLDAIADIIG